MKAGPTFWTYAADGRREPFDPERVGPHVKRCLLCGRRSVRIGIFVPSTPEMRAVVVRLRGFAAPAGSVASLAYGICARHSGHPETPERVEDAFVAAAQKVKVH
jgi:hypothetical protein